MLGQAIIITIGGALLLLPLVFWMFVFSSFSHLGISRKQFLFGLGAGAISTLPLVYSDMFIVGKLIEDVLFSLSFISSSFFGFPFFAYISVFFLIIFILFFGLGKLFIKIENIHKYILSFVGMMFLLSIYSFVLYVFGLFSGNSSSETQITSGDFVFVGLLGITSYYIVISLLEEGVKYISNINILPNTKDISFSVMLASGAVVALGFAFFENILYSYNYIVSFGIETELLRVIFFRSVFTVSLHVLCAMLLSAGFYMLLVLRVKYDKAYILFFIFTIIGIISHAIFDVALTFGYLGVVFLYLFFLYILVGYITSSE